MDGRTQVETEPEALYFENFDLTNIITPVKLDVLNDLLLEAGYNNEKREYLVDGFTNGFSLGYQNKQKVQINSPNLKLEVGNLTILWNKVMKEVKLKRFAGPFVNLPFKDDYIQSPIGLVPKDDCIDVRLISHLSYPRTKNTKSTFVNANTPQHLMKVQYPDFNEAVARCLQEGKNCMIAKSDNRSAFRNLGILRVHWRYLIIKAKSPIDGNWYYFVDKCLPFGTSISCAHYQAVSDAVAFLVEYHTNKVVINYLDDYLFAHMFKRFCDQQVMIFLEVCQKINLPVSDEKTYWSSTSMTFLGFLLDTVNQIIGIPLEKVAKGLNMIGTILSKLEKLRAKRKMTVLQLQKICGFLNFLGRAIVPGRTFTRRLYTQLEGLSHLKLHHHICITDEVFNDLKIWKLFLSQPSVYS